jgi:hypothetical protein
MKPSRIAAAVVLVLLLSAAPSVAQVDRLSKASSDFYNSCVVKVGASPAECACVTGFFGGIMEEDAFVVITAVLPYIQLNGDVDDMEGALATARAKQQELGLSEERFQQIMQTFVDLGTRGLYGDRICVPLAGR